eukprot:1452214-Rhodomonas_salina.3
MGQLRKQHRVVDQNTRGVSNPFQTVTLQLLPHIVEDDATLDEVSEIAVRVRAPDSPHTAIRYVSTGHRVARASIAQLSTGHRRANA